MPEKYTEEMKERFLLMASFMQRANRRAKVSGSRFDIPRGEGKMSVVFYPAKSENAPLILGLHGGGFLFGGNALNDAMWSAVAEKLDMNVASIGYRKSPDHMYQAALDDCLTALEYFRANAAEHGFDPSRILAMGCSAGANLAATMCIYAKKKGVEPIWRQVMLYPVTDLYTDPAEKGDGSLAQPLQYLFNDLHCTPEEAASPLVSPLYAAREELEGLPEAVIIPADHDSLKPEALRYAEMLRAAGVKTTCFVAEDMPHGFFEAGFGQITEEEIEILGPEIGEKVHDGSAAAASERVLARLGECLRG